MSITERLSTKKASVPMFWSSENVMLAAIAAAFLVCHIVAGVILTNAFARAATAAQEDARPSYYD